MLIRRLILHFSWLFLSLISCLVILISIDGRGILYLINSFRKFHHIPLKNNIFWIIVTTSNRFSIIISLIVSLIYLLGLDVLLVGYYCFLFYCVGIAYSTDDLFVFVLKLLDTMLKLLELFCEIYFLLVFV